MTEVLVTGAATLVGGNLVRALVADGQRVRALADPRGNTMAFEGLDVDLYRGLVTVEDEVEAAMKGVSRVYHCATVASMWSRLEPAMRRQNLDGADVVCRLARRLGVERLVHLSSMDAIALPDAEDAMPDESSSWNMGTLELPCAHALHETELRVREHIACGLDAVIVNPTFTLGPWDTTPSSGRLILAVANGRLPGFPKGGTNFVDVRDVCQAMMVCMARGVRGERYILGGENKSYREMIELISEVVGARRPRLKIPHSVAFAAGAFGDFWGGLTGREPIVSGIEVRFAYLDHYCDGSRARDELGMPHTLLRQTVTDAWEWFVAHGYNNRRGRPDAAESGERPRPVVEA